MPELIFGKKKHHKFQANEKIRIGIEDNQAGDTITFNTGEPENQHVLITSAGSEFHIHNISSNNRLYIYSDRAGNSGANPGCDRLQGCGRQSDVENGTGALIKPPVDNSGGQDVVQDVVIEPGQFIQIFHNDLAIVGEDLFWFVFRLQDEDFPGKSQFRRTDQTTSELFTRPRLERMAKLLLGLHEGLYDENQDAKLSLYRNVGESFNETFLDSILWGFEASIGLIFLIDYETSENRVFGRKIGGADIDHLNDRYYGDLVRKCLDARSGFQIYDSVMISKINFYEEQISSIMIAPLYSFEGTLAGAIYLQREKVATISGQKDFDQLDYDFLLYLGDYMSSKNQLTAAKFLNRYLVNSIEQLRRNANILDEETDISDQIKATLNSIMGLAGSIQYSALALCSNSRNTLFIMGPSTVKPDIVKELVYRLDKTKWTRPDWPGYVTLWATESREEITPDDNYHSINLSNQNSAFKASILLKLRGKSRLSSSRKAILETLGNMLYFAMERLNLSKHDGARTREKTFRALLDSLELGYIVFNSSEEIIHTSRVCQKILGKETLRHLYQIDVPVLRNACSRALSSSIQDPVSETFQINGESYSIFASTLDLGPGSKKTAFLAIVPLLKKTSFLSDIRHDLKSGVNMAISSLLYDLELAGAEEAKIETHEKTRQSLMNEISGHINSVARAFVPADTELLHIDIRPLIIEEIVRDILEPYRTNFDSRNIVYSLDVQNNIRKLSVLADYPALRRVLGNLLSNCVNHVPEGSRVNVRISQDQSSPDRLAFVVADTGPGLSAEAVNNLARPLGFLSDSEHGRGLLITRELLSRMDSLLVVSKLEGYSTALGFSLRFQK